MYNNINFFLKDEQRTNLYDEFCEYFEKKKKKNVEDKQNQENLKFSESPSKPIEDFINKKLKETHEKILEGQKTKLNTIYDEYVNSLNSNDSKENLPNYKKSTSFKSITDFRREYLHAVETSSIPQNELKDIFTKHARLTTFFEPKQELNQEEIKSNNSWQFESRR